jgi:hypothetical protein
MGLICTVMLDGPVAKAAEENSSRKHIAAAILNPEYMVQ